MRRRKSERKIERVETESEERERGGGERGKKRYEIGVGMEIGEKKTVTDRQTDRQRN